MLNDWISEIAQGLAGLVHIFNPQLILIGGGVSAQQELLIDPLAAQVCKSVMRPLSRRGWKSKPPLSKTTPVWSVPCIISGKINNHNITPGTLPNLACVPGVFFVILTAMHF